MSFLFCIFFFRIGKVLCCHFTWQNVGSNFCPYDRSGPHRDKNTWICFTISVFVPGRKGYFCLVLAGLWKKGTLLCSQAVSKWQVWKPNTCWEVPRRPSRHLRWQSKVQIWTHLHLVPWPWDPMIVTSEPGWVSGPGRAVKHRFPRLPGDDGPTHHTQKQ